MNMSQKATSVQTQQQQPRSDSIQVRDRYVRLGMDSNGEYHVYRTVDETIHVIGNGERTYRVNLLECGKTVDDWMEFVDKKRGWETVKYGKSIVTHLIDELESSGFFESN